ncbi:uncharacterized protein M6B38_161425 [Iris pallida]|uniref:Uncharacterized protein n=1 Tax=Iris pallida TaxID=29817 RepID=A0AAX6EYH2_IRIPA|nr:uncharacterized protein M6B38_161425 [Iris pallida]
MLMTDDLDLNRLLAPEPEPAKDALRRRILQHEFIFRSQVRELHRLYWTQMNLTRRAEKEILVGSESEKEKEVKGRSIDSNENARSAAARAVHSLHCYEVIDLEEPAESERDEAPPARAAMRAGLGERRGERASPHSRSGICETNVVASIDVSIGLNQKPPPPSSKPLLIDLNIAQDDESSHDFNNPIMTFTSPSSSSSVIQQEIWRDQDSGSKVTCDTLNPYAPNPALESSKGKNREWWLDGCQSDNSKVRETIQSCKHEGGNKVEGSNSIGSAEYPGNLAEEFSSSNAGVRNSTRVTTLSSTKFSKTIEENANSSSVKQPSITYSDSRRQTSITTSNNEIEIKQANHGGYEEDTVSSHALAQDEKEDAPVAKFPTESKSDRMTCGSCDTSSQDKSVGENSGTTHLESWASEQINPHHEDQATEMDCAVAGAAEALVRIALEKSFSLVDKSGNTAPTVNIDDEEEDRCDEPQYSSDSFASMTLKLSEIKSKYIMPTKEFESGAGDDARVDKLRRGRGRVRAVKDFQKDILPGMASLSRHEICEDMHSIGYELRRNGSRRTCEDNWFVPARSRRSRRYSACRRH